MRTYIRLLAIALFSISAALMFAVVAIASPNSGLIGNWSMAQPPDAGSGDNSLAGIHCLSAADCWAVGYKYVTTGTSGDPVSQTLIEHYDGAVWTVASSPNVDTARDQFLYDVSCSSATDCWAVGYRKTANGASLTLAVHYDGATWTVVTSPNTAANTNSLGRVTCLTSNDCWAVGSSFTNAPPLPSLHGLIEHYDGNSWAIVAGPMPAYSNGTPSPNRLRDITCLSATDCWVVGDYSSFETGRRTLIAHYNGTSWSMVESPNEGSNTNALYGVTCASITDCWASGYGENSLFQPQVVTVHYDGIAWSIDHSGPTQAGILGPATCLSANDCWALGVAYSENSTLTLIEHWDGNSWSLAPSPNVLSSQTNNGFGDLSCINTANCWAVAGARYDIPNGSSPTSVKTMIQHYDRGVPFVAASARPNGENQLFGVNIPISGTLGIEPQSGGSNSDYSLVFTFIDNVTANPTVELTDGDATITSSVIGPNSNQVTVSLTAVTNAEILTLRLTDFQDSAGRMATFSVPVGILIGDANGDGSVNSADLNQIKSQAGNTANETNFRQDLNADGIINSADVSLAKSKSGTGLP